MKQKVSSQKKEKK